MCCWSPWSWAHTVANAATIKATGSWQIDATWFSQNDLENQTKDNTFSIGQRMRTKFEFIANENLKGVLETQIGTNSWGNGLYQVSAGRTPNTTATGSLNAGGGNIILRKGYLDFKWPGTAVNFLVGYQSLSLPSAVGGGSAILDDHVAGAAVVVPVNANIALVAGYARPLDANTYGATASRQGTGTQADDAFLFANLSYGGIKLSPFFNYAYAGKQVAGNLVNGMAIPNLDLNDGARGYWGGVAFTMTTFEPFKVMADFNYGSANANYNGGAGHIDWKRSGWLFDMAIDYTGLSMMTPELLFAYTSGENSNIQKSERMPMLSAENYALGSFFMQGGDSLAASYNGPNTAMGFWALGVSLKDIKLIDKLSHTFNVIYFKGTNSKTWLQNIAAAGLGAGLYGRTLTEKDSLVEVDLNSKYQIYEELSLALELGYLSTSFDKSLWSGVTGLPTSKLSKDAYKANVMLNYSF